MRYKNYGENVRIVYTENSYDTYDILVQEFDGVDWKVRHKTNSLSNGFAYSDSEKVAERLMREQLQGLHK